MTTQREIERKFLVKDESWKEQLSTKHTKMYIQQIYLINEPELSLRLQYRERYGLDQKAALNFKIPGHGIARDETELELNWLMGLRLIETLTLKGKHPTIRKERSFVDITDMLYWEIDVFLNDSLRGLVLAEVELPDENYELTLPDWVGKEVTDDPSFYNANLAEQQWTSLSQGIRV